MSKIINKLANLLSVKSLIALVLTGVFAVLSVWGAINQDFLTVYVVIITFYFTTDQGSKTGDSGGESA